MAYCDFSHVNQLLNSLVSNLNVFCLKVKLKISCSLNTEDVSIRSSFLKPKDILYKLIIFVKKLSFIFYKIKIITISIVCNFKILSLI